jgi:2-hydroxycyclohexanecarboxyl-CoA dehydrogenase
VTELMQVDGRVALITGAGQGVGRQTALLLAELGAQVAVNDFFADRAESVVQEIRAAGGTAVAAPADVTDLPAVQWMVESVGRELGPVDILVNNAGNAGPATSLVETVPFWETGEADWQKWMGVNFYGVLHVTRCVLPAMVERRSGRLVTVISDAGRVGEPNMVVYSGAKAGAAGLMRAIAKAVGRYGITANCVALSAIATPTTEELVGTEESRKALLRNYVIRRVGTPQDAAPLIAFLCGDAASWITGQTYPVNGGYAFAV